jgi:hypothetical protein
MAIAGLTSSWRALGLDVHQQTMGVLGLLDGSGHSAAVAAITG